MTTPRPSVGLQARHVRRVGPDDVGARVSLRRWVTDPRRGPVHADVVGRLLAFDEQGLVVVDRDGVGVRVGADAVVSSRVVPEHPRLPAEPTDAGSRDRPLRRVVLRAVCFDAEGRVLLVRGPTAWEAPALVPERRAEPTEALRAWVVGELDADERRVTVAPAALRRTGLAPAHGLWWRTEERWHPVGLPDAAPAAPGESWAWMDPTDPAGPVDPPEMPAHLVRWRERPPSTCEDLPAADA